MARVNPRDQPADGAERGAATMVQRQTAAFQANEQYDDQYYDEGEYDDSYYGEGESEETVTEIVGERVEELESEVNVEEEIQQQNEQNQQQIENFLEVDQEQYINQEYNMDQKESPVKKLQEFDYNPNEGLHNMVSPIVEDQ